MAMLEEQGCGFISVVVRDMGYIEGEIDYEEFCRRTGHGTVY